MTALSPPARRVLEVARELEQPFRSKDLAVRAGVHPTGAGQRLRELLEHQAVRRELVPGTGSYRYEVVDRVGRSGPA